MTRRKDPQPETIQPETASTEPFVAEVDPTPDPAVESAVSTSDPLPAPPQPAPPKPAPPQPAPPRGPGIFGPLLGGALAAIGGFALSHFNVLGLAQPSEMIDLAPLTARLEDATASQTASLDRISGEIATLASRIARLESVPAPDLSRLDALDKRLGVIEAMPAGGSGSTSALAARLSQLEQRIAALPAGGADPALQQKLDDALARLSDAESAATVRAAEAEAAVAQAARDRALDTLADAVATGKPFAAELQALTDPALAEALAPSAESGVPTLATLQDSFPDAAREALRNARHLGTEDGWGDRLVDFLASQTGARSLTPQEGTTPDAILSRAEFALSEGRVADALTEMDPLDPAVKAPLADWMAQAQAHLAAGAALQTARGE